MLITTAASTPTAYSIYSSDANTGEGKVTVGGTDPVAWWVNVPANVTAGAYDSTITLSIVSDPFSAT